jgi:hypothetical protein
MKRSRTDTNDNGRQQVHPDAPTAKGSAGDSENSLAQRNGSGTACHVLADVDPIENGSNGAPFETCSKPTTAGHDHLGRFTKGNPGGPGNPFGRRLAYLRKVLCAHINEADIETAVCQLRDRMCRGDLAAVKLLLLYAIGRPLDAVNPDTIDLQEWQLFQKQPVEHTDLVAILTGLSPEVACRVLRAALPSVAAGQAQMLQETLVTGKVPEMRAEVAEEPPQRNGAMV